ncbi:MAG: hypothetical protein QM535_00290 [Limnohabitans sp.]|nr:hypothetical protein [Limnohabitans sp.]
MEQNKFDDKVKEQFNSREIEPTEKAWDRLDAMLSSVETINEKPKKSFVWILSRIAAVLLLMLGLGIWYFNVTEQNSINNIDGQNRIVVDKTNLSLPKIDANKESISSSIVVHNEVNSEKKSMNTVNRKKYAQIQISQNQVLKNNDEQKGEMSVQNELVVVNEVKNEVPEKIEFVKPKLKIDPNILLEQVGDEQSIKRKSKLMNLLKKKYENVKVAIENRNIEEEAK